MKHPVRPLLTILLLIAVATTFSIRVAFYRSTIFSSKPELRVQSLPAPAHRSTIFSLKPELRVHSLPPPVFNSTLLKFATIELGEAESKQEIEQLLQGNLASQGPYRTFFRWWERSNSNPHQSGARTPTGSPVNLKSSEFNQYWLDFRRNLHDWARNKMFQPDVMMDLVRLVKHPIDSHNGLISSDKKYKSCAVVGNSGILLNRNYGELIDSHEVVIRLNNARTGPYERKVGSKTSISFVNSNILHLCSRSRECFCHPYGENVPIIMYICQPVHFLDYTVCNSYYKGPLLITDSRFDVLCARIVKYYSAKRFVEETGKPLDEWGSAHEGVMFHYSSGMQAIMLALGICDSVRVFGFGKSTSAKHHYHTSQRAELTLHDYEAEYAFYHDLVENPRAIPFISDKFRFPPVVIYQ